MDYIDLNTDERQALQEALLSAFPSEGALRQVTFFHLGQNLEAIAGGNNLTQIVQSLIQWAEQEGKTPDLIVAARKVNTGNSKLREFEQSYKAKRERVIVDNGVGVSPLTKALRDQLRDALLQVPQSGSFEGRSAYLIGMPWAQSLNRSPVNSHLDLEMMIDQLNTLGRLDSGEWPVLLLIDNAVSGVRGTAVGRVLLGIRETLAQAHKEGGNAQ